MESRRCSGDQKNSRNGVARHQSGIALRLAGNQEEAERSFLEALRLASQFGLRDQEAATLNELGNLYDNRGAAEEAERFYRQAVHAYDVLGDRSNAGRARFNLGTTLTTLGRYVQAREPLEEALGLLEPLAPAAEPWMVHDALSRLERMAGNASAADEARQKAIRQYLSYRRSGVERRTLAAQLTAMVAESLRTGATREVAEQLERIRATDENQESVRRLAAALMAVLDGRRDPALADDPEMDYDDAAEFLLLIESIDGRP